MVWASLEPAEALPRAQRAVLRLAAVVQSP